MSRKLLLLMLLALLVGTLNLASGVEKVEASESIYIRADGSVEGTTHIQIVDNVTYFLSADIDGYMEIQRDNIILDGDGYTLQGFAGTAAGIYLLERTNVTIQNLNVDDHYYSIFLSFSSNNTISRCNVTSSAIYLDRSSNNIISRNDIEFFGSYGICCSQSDNNNICENTMNCGISIGGSNHNSISGNNVAGAGTAILLASSYIDGIKFSSNNIISGNSIENNGIGVQVDSTSNNTIYHNNLMNNTRQVSVTAGYTTFWDGGYPSGGNYWSDYTGIDADGDGIGDAPYVIDANNHDRYPLMHPWSTPPVRNINTGLGYATIQGAINANETLDGQTISVDAGKYMEHVRLTKSLRFVGTNRESTIIDGSGMGNVVEITVDNVTVCGFTVRNSGTNDSDSGILLNYTENCHISRNCITNNSVGIFIRSIVTKTFDVVTENDVANNSVGIYLTTAYNATITANTLTDNKEGIVLFASSNNTLFHNNFSRNNEQVFNWGESGAWPNVWDDGYASGGNFWSDYTGTDTNDDGFGDASYNVGPYIIGNVDHYPLMGTFGSFTIASQYLVQTICNSTISSFRFNGTAISFNVSGEDGTTGFCRLTIPHTLLSPPFNITVNNNPVVYSPIFENETLSIIYFNYSHSTHEVVVVSELPSFPILPLFMIATLLAVIVHRKKHAQRGLSID
jgi:parallel beta-helix repeat protein